MLNWTASFIYRLENGGNIQSALPSGIIYPRSWLRSIIFTTLAQRPPFTELALPGLAERALWEPAGRKSKTKLFPKPWLAVAFVVVNGVANLRVFQVLAPAKEAHLACRFDTSLHDFRDRFAAPHQRFMEHAAIDRGRGRNAENPKHRRGDVDVPARRIIQEALFEVGPRRDQRVARVERAERGMRSFAPRPVHRIHHARRAVI